MCSCWFTVCFFPFTFKTCLQMRCSCLFSRYLRNYSLHCFDWVLLDSTASCCLWLLLPRAWKSARCVSVQPHPEKQRQFPHVPRQTGAKKLQEGRRSRESQHNSALCHVVSFRSGVRICKHFEHWIVFCLTACTLWRAASRAKHVLNFRSQRQQMLPTTVQTFREERKTLRRLRKTRQSWWQRELREVHEPWLWR